LDRRVALFQLPFHNSKYVHRDERMVPQLRFFETRHNAFTQVIQYGVD
jgi:hypothetical protein